MGKVLESLGATPAGLRDNVSLGELVRNVAQNWYTLMLPAIQPFILARKLSASESDSTGIGGVSMQYFVKKMLFTKINQARQSRKNEGKSSLLSTIHVANNPTQVESVAVAHRSAGQNKIRVQQSSIYMAVDIGDNVILCHPFQKRKTLHEWVCVHYSHRHLHSGMAVVVPRQRQPTSSSVSTARRYQDAEKVPASLFRMENLNGILSRCIE